jgi:hypothetical protein
VLSRYLLIALAFGAAGLRISQGAWVEATGLGSLALGLVALQLSRSVPQFRVVAWALFAITAVAMGIVFVRMGAG